MSSINCSSSSTLRSPISSWIAAASALSIWPAGKAAMSTTCEAPSKRSLLDQTLLWSFWDCILNLKQKMLLRNMCFTLKSYVESTYCEPKLKKSSYHIQPESKEKSLGWFFHCLKHRWTKWLKLCPKNEIFKNVDVFRGFFVRGRLRDCYTNSGHSRTFFSHHLLRFSHQLLPFSHLVRLPNFSGSLAYVFWISPVVFLISPVIIWCLANFENLCNFHQKKLKFHL